MSHTKRSICKQCGFPNSTCLCEHISQFQLPFRLIVLQHPMETKHAKNTARLIKLCIPECDIEIGESETDFNNLVESLKNEFSQTWLLYPNQVSCSLPKVLTGQSTKNNKPPKNLILLDATWRKAFKMWQLNPWLHQIPSWHFDPVPTSQYRIRKTHVQGGLSTLEAAAHAIDLLTDKTPYPLYTALEAMQLQRDRFI